MDEDDVLQWLRERLSALSAEDHVVHDDEVETSVQLQVSEALMQLRGGEVTLLHEGGVTSGVLEDYEIGDVQLRDDAVHVPIALRMALPPGAIEVHITEVDE